MKFTTPLAALLLLVSSAALAGQFSASPTVPEALGFDIHFTSPQPGEMKMLAASGVRWVRMDFAWDRIEKLPGRYDFSEYDRLLAALEPYRIRPIFILCYSNLLYDGGLSPYTDAGRRAFANWVAASVQHFQGHGILWEMYNEPNWATFWRPRPDVDDYIKLALAVGEAIQENTPGETYIGPATAVIDPPFIEACFKAGLLNYWSAVSVHPYRQADPETAAADFRNLRLMIAKYAPKGKQIPIISGEWGYSSVWAGMDEPKQGEMLAREWLTNLTNNIPLSIWYDWHDDGTDPKNPEHHFGTTENRYEPNHDPVYQPKPAYLAARTLTSFFKRDHYNKRLAVGNPDDYVLLFSDGANSRLAAWTTSVVPHEVVIPASPGAFGAVGLTGQELPRLRATRSGLRVRLARSPLYLVPLKRNKLIQLTSASGAAPLEVLTHAPSKVTVALRVRNPLPRPIQVRLERGDWTVVPAGGSVSLTVTRDNIHRPVDPIPWRIDLEARRLGRFAQVTGIVVSNPLRATLLPVVGNILPAALSNPSGEAFAGSVEISEAQGLVPQGPAAIEFKAGETATIAQLKLAAAGAPAYRAGLRILDRQGNAILSVPATQFVRYPASVTAGDYALVLGEKSAAPKDSTLSIADPPEGPPVPGMHSVKLDYHFQPGLKSIRITPRTRSQSVIESQPRSLGFWIYGDGEGNAMFVRFADSTGQIFQEGGGAIDWKGWRYVTCLLGAAHAGHWDGASDGVIHYPIHWESSFVLARPERRGARFI